MPTLRTAEAFKLGIGIASTDPHRVATCLAPDEHSLADPRGPAVPDHATTVTNPLAGHIVRFPTAIPNEQWMADRMLWADQIGAVWPSDQRPEPMSESEANALSAADLYQDAGFFTECVVPSTAFAGTTPAALGMGTQQLREWVSGLPKADDNGRAAEVFKTPRDAYFYVNKLGDGVSEMLVRAGVAHRTDDNFIELKSAKAARTLMATIAACAEPNGGGSRPITFDSVSDMDLASAAAPVDGESAHAAIVVDLPVVTAARATDARRIIDFRISNRNERARQDYLAAVEEHVEAQVFIFERSADELRAEKVRSDLLKASQSLIRHHGAAGLTVYGATAVSALVAVPQVTEGWMPAAAAAAGLTGAAASGLIMIRGSRTNRYLRRGQRAGILAGPVGTRA